MTNIDYKIRLLNIQLNQEMAKHDLLVNLYDRMILTVDANPDAYSQDDLDKARTAMSIQVWEIDLFRCRLDALKEGIEL